MKLKLTPAQTKLLLACSDEEQQVLVVRTFKPLIALVTAGLATEVKSRRPSRAYVELTPKGRELVAVLTAAQPQRG